MRYLLAASLTSSYTVVGVIDLLHGRWNAPWPLTIPVAMALAYAAGLLAPRVLRRIERIIEKF